MVLAIIYVLVRDCFNAICIHFLVLFKMLKNCRELMDGQKEYRRKVAILQKAAEEACLKGENDMQRIARKVC